MGGTELQEVVREMLVLAKTFSQGWDPLETFSLELKNIRLIF